LLSIRVEAERCTGCRLCEVVCSIAHSGEGALVAALRAELPFPRVRVLGSDSGYGLAVCRHCERPRCVDGCVSGALYVDPQEGIVDVDPERCVGCWSCVMECPFGAITLITADHGPFEATRATKCDGCRDIGAPLCLRFCPTGALRGADGARGLAGETRRSRARRLAGGEG